MWVALVACRGCLTDSDCPGGGVATGCHAVLCSVTTHLCESVDLPDGTECAPGLTDIDTLPCSASQTGACSNSVCVVGGADSQLICMPDSSCLEVSCNASTGDCALLEGPSLACGVVIPTCADGSTAVCNGWGYCAIRVSSTCNDGNPCTDDSCNYTAGFCTNTRNHACGALGAVGITTAVLTSLVMTIIFVVNILGLVTIIVNDGS